MNMTKPKQTCRHRKQTSGYHLGERREKRQDKNRGKVLASAAHILKKRIGVKRHKLLGIK